MIAIYFFLSILCSQNRFDTIPKYPVIDTLAYNCQSKELPVATIHMGKDGSTTELTYKLMFREYDSTYIVRAANRSVIKKPGQEPKIYEGKSGYGLYHRYVFYDPIRLGNNYTVASMSEATVFKDSCSAKKAAVINAYRFTDMYGGYYRKRYHEVN
jgi:hypothetical protein